MGIGNCPSGRARALLLLGLSMAISGRAAAAVELSVEDAAVAEGNSGTRPLPFSIHRSGADIASSQLIFQAQTVDASASAPSDYVSLSSTTVRMPASTDNMQLEIGLRGDTAAEGDERFVLKLSDAVLTGPDPAFSGPTGFPVDAQFLVQHQPVAIAQGDINGDGRPDIAVAKLSVYSREAAVLLNTTPAGAATPSFSGPNSYLSGNSPSGVALADLDGDGDGKPDLAVANGGSAGLPGSLAVFRNTTSQGATSSSFARASQYLNDPLAECGPLGVAAGDLNADGRLDLAAACNVSGELAVLLNTTPAGSANLSFSSLRIVATDHAVLNLALADINNDGRLDAILNTLAAPYDGHVAVLLNTTPDGASSASFGPLVGFPVGDVPGRVAIADINEDGRPDLAVPIGENTNADPSNPYHKASRVTVLLNLTPAGADSPSFGPLNEYFSSSGCETAVWTDANGDGRPDLFTDGANGPLEMYLNATPRTATAPRLIASGTIPTPGSIKDLTVADFNSDGREDIAMANWASEFNEASVLLNTADQLPPGTDTAAVMARGEASGTILNDDGGTAPSSSGGSSSGGSSGSTSSGSSGATGSGSSSGATGSSGSGGADSEAAGGGALWIGDLLLVLLAGGVGRLRRRAR